MRVEIERRENYILMRCSPTKRNDSMSSLDMWLKDRGIGKQVGINRYKVDNEDALTYIKLCFAGENIEWVDLMYNIY